MCLVPSPGEFWASRNDFSKCEKMAQVRSMCLWLLLRRMKACMAEFQPNTSQASPFEGFWRISGKTNMKINVRKQFESSVPIADSSKCAAHVVETQWILFCMAFTWLSVCKSLLIFCVEYYGFPETKIFFFWKFNFCLFQWGIALYGTVNNERDIIFWSCMVKNT